MSAFHKRNTEQFRVGDFNDGKKRYFDENFELIVVKIFSGECYISTQENEMLVTILGSCVAACIRDPSLGIGGMNHFLLPGDDRAPENAGESMRYGAFAMENLLNGLYKLGAKKERLEIKIFGGGNVMANSAMIGHKNAKFIREFLKKEGFKTASEDLEGSAPRRLHYFPATGKALVRKLHRKEDMIVIDQEVSFKEKLQALAAEGDVELFS